ncbi:MAG: hypothetical protein RLZZ174_1230 [Pseudomonadota bacterium]
MATLRALVPILAPAKQWIAQQSPRDQRLLRLLGVALGGLLLWQLCLAPVLDYRDRAAARLARAQADLAWLTANERALAQALAARQQAQPQGEAALQAVAASAQAYGLTLNRFSPEGEGRLALSLDNAAYDALLKWLLELTETRGLRVLTLSIDRTDTPGQVRARLVLG